VSGVAEPGGRGRHGRPGSRAGRELTLSDDPFSLLGLPPRPSLSDEEVRAAWRRVAAATHPDRADGGDPARFGAAAAAYVLLRTSFERGEALAELGAAPPRPRIRRTGPRGAHRVSANRAGRAFPGRAHAGHSYPGRAHRAGRARGARATTGRVWLNRDWLSQVWLSRDWLNRDWLSRDWLSRDWLSRVWAARPELPGRGGPGLGRGFDRGLSLRVASAAVVAAATVAAVGLTPATIGLLAGALTVSCWALWRRGGWGR
jgi:hypothetical protein